MKQKFDATVSIIIDAPAAKVWDALTNPDMIKQYLFGTKAISDWKEGSDLTYKGVWEGKEYEDKGKIVKLEPGKILSTTYWSAFSGLPDTPENYQTVVYELAPQGGATQLTITQGNIPTEQARDHSAQNWNTVLDSMKKLLEK